MITTPGIPPIIVHGFDQLKTELRRNQDDSASQKSKEVKSEKVSAKEEKQQSESAKSDNSLTQLNFAEIEQKLKEIMQEENVNLQFSMDKPTQKMVLKVIDSETNEVLRQYPPEVALKIARMVSENGTLANVKV